MVIEIKRAKSVSASKVRTLDKSKQQSVSTSQKASSAGRTIRKLSNSKRIEDPILKGIERTQSKTTTRDLKSEQKFSKLVKSKPSDKLPYNERVIAIDKWISDNESILTDPRYSQEAQRLILAEKQKLRKKISSESASAVSELSDIKVKGLSYSEYKSKIDEWEEKNKDALSRGIINYDKIKTSLDAVDKNLAEKNVNEFNIAVKDFESTWKKGDYHTNVDKLNTFLSTNKEILGRGTNYDKAIKLLESKQDLLQTDYQELTSLKGVDGKYLSVAALESNPEYIKEYYPTGELKSIKGKSKSYKKYYYKRKKKGRDTRRRERYGSYTPYELTFDIDGDKIKEVIRTDYESEEDYDRNDKGYTKTEERRVADMSTILYDSNGKILKKYTKQRVNTFSDKDDRDRKYVYEMKDLLIENYKDGNILNKSIFDDYTDKKKSYEGRDREKEYEDIYLDKYYDYENNIMQDFYRPDTEIRTSNRYVKKRPSLSVGNTFVSQDKTKDYYGKSVTVVGGKIVSSDKAAAIISNFNKTHSSGSSNSGLKKMSVIGIDEYNLAKYNMSTSEMEALRKSDRDMYLKLKKDVGDRIKYGSVTADYKERKVTEDEFRNNYTQDILQRQEASIKLDDLTKSTPGMSTADKGRALKGDFGLSPVALGNLNKTLLSNNQRKQDIDLKYSIQEEGKLLGDINKQTSKLTKETGLDKYTTAASAFEKEKSQKNYVALQKATLGIQDIDDRTMKAIQEKSMMMDVLGGRVNKKAKTLQMFQDRREQQVKDLQSAELAAKDLRQTIIDRDLSYLEAEDLRVKTKLDLANTRRDFAVDVDIHGEYFTDLKEPINKDNHWSQTLIETGKGLKRVLWDKSTEQKQADFLEIKEDTLFSDKDIVGQNEVFILGKDTPGVIGHSVSAISGVSSVIGDSIIENSKKSRKTAEYQADEWGKILKFASNLPRPSMSGLVPNNIKQHSGDISFEPTTTDQAMVPDRDLKLKSLFTAPAKISEGVGKHFKYDPVRVGFDMTLGAATAGTTAMIGSAAKTSALFGTRLLKSVKAAKKIKAIKKAGTAVGVGANILGTGIYAGSTGVEVFMAAPGTKLETLGKGIARYGTFELGMFAATGALNLGKAAKIYDPNFKYKSKYIKHELPKPQSRAILEEFRTISTPVEYKELKVTKNPFSRSKIETAKRIRDMSIDDIAKLDIYSPKEIPYKLRGITEGKVSLIESSEPLKFKGGKDIKLPKKSELRLEKPVDAFVAGEPGQIINYRIHDRPGKPTRTEISFKHKYTGEVSSYEQVGNIARGYSEGSFGKLSNTPLISIDNPKFVSKEPLGPKQTWGPKNLEIYDASDMGYFDQVSKPSYTILGDPVNYKITDIKKGKRLKFIEELPNPAGSIVDSGYGIRQVGFDDMYPTPFSISKVQDQFLLSNKKTYKSGLLLQKPTAYKVVSRGQPSLASEVTAINPLTFEGKTFGGKRVSVLKSDLPKGKLKDLNIDDMYQTPYSISKGQKKFIESYDFQKSYKKPQYEEAFGFEGISFMSRPHEKQVIKRQTQNVFSKQKFKKHGKDSMNFVENIDITTTTKTKSPLTIEVERGVDMYNPKELDLGEKTTYGQFKIAKGNKRAETVFGVRYEGKGIGTKSTKLSPSASVVSEMTQKQLAKSQSKVSSSNILGDDFYAYAPTKPLSKKAPKRLKADVDLSPETSLVDTYRQTTSQDILDVVKVDRRLDLDFSTDIRPTRKLKISKKPVKKPLIARVFSNKKAQSSMFGTKIGTGSQVSKVRPRSSPTNSASRGMGSSDDIMSSFKNNLLQKETSSGTLSIFQDTLPGQRMAQSKLKFTHAPKPKSTRVVSQGMQQSVPSIGMLSRVVAKPKLKSSTKQFHYYGGYTRSQQKQYQPPVIKLKNKLHTDNRLGGLINIQTDRNTGMFGRTELQQESFNDMFAGYKSESLHETTKAMKSTTAVKKAQAYKLDLKLKQQQQVQQFQQLTQTSSGIRRTPMRSSPVPNIPKIPRSRKPEDIEKIRPFKLPKILIKQKVVKKKRKSKKGYEKKKFGVLELLKVKKSSGSVLNFM